MFQSQQKAASRCGARIARPCRLRRTALLLLGGMTAFAANANPALHPSMRLLPDNWLQVDTDLAFDPKLLDARWNSLVRTPLPAPDYSLASAVRVAPWMGTGGLPVHLETGDSTHLRASEPQAYVRPQFALGGGSSESLRHWVRVAGISATSCTAPLMKMHSGFAGGSTHANVSVSARCSFH